MQTKYKYVRTTLTEIFIFFVNVGLKSNDLQRHVDWEIIKNNNYNIHNNDDEISYFLKDY